MSHLKVNCHHRHHQGIFAGNELQAAVALDDPRQKSKVSSPDVEVLVDLHPTRHARKNTFYEEQHMSFLLLLPSVRPAKCRSKEQTKRNEFIVQSTCNSSSMVCKTRGGFSRLLWGLWTKAASNPGGRWAQVSVHGGVNISWLLLLWRRTGHWKEYVFSV